MSQRKKPPREKDLTSRFFSGDFETDRVPKNQRFTDRSKNAQQNRIEKTATLRGEEEDQIADMESLPIGSVILVHSLFCQVYHETGIRLCVVRKTLAKLGKTAIVVGDLVRFRDRGTRDELGRPEAVIEQVLPRKTILTRADSFQGRHQHPIVANADQMLIVAALVQPNVKWGLIDRLLVAAQSGGLIPILCLNKIDLAGRDEESQKHLIAAQVALDHYQSMGIVTIKASAVGETGKLKSKGSGVFVKTPDPFDFASAEKRFGIDRLREVLAGKNTVLAGSSGVGKSTLISAVQPGLDIRIGEVSAITDKGRHTTTSVRRYPLDAGGFVIDTPGVKVFGLWQVSQENLLKYFPDVENETAPAWRLQSYQRIAETI